MIRRLSVSNTVLLIICLMYLILYVDRVNISTAAPLIKADLDLSNTQLGLAFSAFAYPYALFQLIGGYFGDKFGARLTLFVSGLIVCAARRRQLAPSADLQACLPRGFFLGLAKARPFRPRRARWRRGCRSAAGVSLKASRIRLRGLETR
jgi:MFS family permease